MYVRAMHGTFRMHLTINGYRSKDTKNDDEKKKLNLLV